MIKYRLKVLLAINDLTQTQLAEMIGVRQPTISAMSRGSMKHIPADLLDKLCAALNCQPGDLLEYIPEAKEKQSPGT